MDSGLGGKPLTAGGGGVLITDNEELARRAKGFANKGSEYDEGLRNSLRPTSEQKGSPRGYSFLGDFHPMSNLMAAVGVAQLGRIDDYVARRRAAGAILEDMLWGSRPVKWCKSASSCCCCLARIHRRRA